MCHQRRRSIALGRWVIKWSTVKCVSIWGSLKKAPRAFLFALLSDCWRKDVVIGLLGKQERKCQFQLINITTRGWWWQATVSVWCSIDIWLLAVAKLTSARSDRFVDKVKETAILTVLQPPTSNGIKIQRGRDETRLKRIISRCTMIESETVGFVLSCVGCTPHPLCNFDMCVHRDF